MITKITFFTQKYKFLSFFITLIGILFYQSLNLFWGFELADSGFHLTAFDNIFDAPNSVSYNFMYYLTNVIGGGFLRLFPEIGLLGFRVVGALFIDMSLLLIFICLRKEISVIHLLVGFVLVVVSYFMPYSFNNGILSCFFYVCFLLLLYKGIISRSVLLVLLSGILVGINIFSRIPNVLAVGLFFVTLYHRWIENRILKCDWRTALFFMFGILVGIAVSVLMIFLFDHQSAFMEALDVLFLKGTSSSDGHSFWKLIWTQFYFYLNGAIFIALFISISYIAKFQIQTRWKIIFVVISSFIVFYHIYLNLYIEKGYEPLWAICVIGCIICIKQKGSFALLAFLGLYMLIFEILGSGSGNNHGSLPALLAAPVSCSVLINRKNILYVMVACMALFLKVVKQGNYFDYGPLLLKQCYINVDECYMIRTTVQRAEAMNNTLPVLKQYVHPDDTLLVYNAAPMMNYLTHTRPAGGMCWPGDVGLFVKPFERTPKILIHKFGDFTEPTLQTRGIPTGNQKIDSYIHEHQYKIVWENPYFILLFPHMDVCYTDRLSYQYGD